ncbi:SPOR domain-containing protein [Tabrizicola sp.]|uniref:SPOR domain-containing protein n=1 Tax=Tabrizicola sp. TaxID=2005166 RepID=UPI003F40BF4F
MADADYDFGGGLSHESQSQRYGAKEAMAAEKVQRYINIAGGLASLALVIGLGFWGYKLAVRDVNGVPVIQAMDGPMRISPVDPGGEIADHQGLAVNNVAEVGTAAPSPERLVLAPRPVELTPEDTAGLGGQLLPGLAEASAPSDLMTADSELALAATPLTESADPTEVAVEAALAEALGTVPEEELATLPVEEPAPEGAITTSIRPKARPGTRTETAPVEAVAMAAPNEVDPATITPGTRLVQFGTFDTAEEARAAWTRLQGRFGELMAEKGLVLQPAESGGRTFYRLRAHGFEGEDDARRFCSAFVAENMICIPVPHK